MPRPPQRRLALLDLMVLIAATAVGAHGIQRVWAYLPLIQLSSPLDMWPVGGLLIRAPHAVSAALPLVAAWTVAVLILSMCRPRPPLRRLASRPGMAACTAATVALFANVIRYLVALAVFGDRSQTVFDGRMWHSVYVDRGLLACFWLDQIRRPTCLGIAVAAVWMWLVLGRRWRPQPTWIDRMGRALGVYWLLMIFWSILLEIVATSRLVTFALPIR